MGESARSSGRLVALVESIQAVGEARELSELCEAVFAVLGRFVPVTSAALLLRDGEHLEVAGFMGAQEGLCPGERVELSEDLPATRAVRSGQPHVERGEGRAVVAVPMLAGGDSIGVVQLACQEPSECSEETLVLLNGLASSAGVALRNLRSLDELAGEKSRLQAILECSADAIVTTDQGGRVTFFSRGAEQMFGYAAADVLGHQVTEFYLEGEKGARRVQLHIQDEGQVRNLEVWFKTASGERVPTSLSASVLRDHEGRVLGTLGVLKDITVEKRLERKLSYTIEMLQDANESLGRLAVTDELSGLKNQRFFYRKLEEELLRAERTRREVSLLLIDIDKFKRFNDSHGHQVGDRVIHEMGRTISASIRQIDHGCRYGGEEFTIILPETPLESALVVAQRIRTEFARREAWQELGLDPPTLSIGVGEFEGSGEREGTPDVDGLVRQADAAMYRAKNRGGDGIETA